MMLAAGALLIAACGQPKADTEAIRQAATGYLEAMGAYRVADAEPFASQYTCENTLPVLARMTEVCDTAFIVANTPAEFTIAAVKVVSDSVALVAYHKHTPITDADDTLTMVLEEGCWLADVRIGPVPIPLDGSSYTDTVPYFERQMRAMEEKKAAKAQ